MSEETNTERPTEPNFDKGNGLITVVAQDAVSGAVLMVAHMDREAYDRTRATGEMYYRSRTRGLWHKGATSGNIQRVQSLALDCDGDTILARVIPAGPACHTGDTSCFGADGEAVDVITQLSETIHQRATSYRPDEASSSYTHKLLGNRNLRFKKLGEEAVELAVALADNDKTRAIEEGADVIYHTLVALAAQSITLRDVQVALQGRMAHRTP